MTPSDYVGLIDNRIGPGFGKPMQPQNPPAAGTIGSVLRDIAKQPSMQPPMQPPTAQMPMVRTTDYREGRDYTIDPRTGQHVPVRNYDPFGGSFTAPPAGMAPVDPNKAMRMKHGGRAAMPKGKR